LTTRSRTKIPSGGRRSVCITYAHPQGTWSNLNQTLAHSPLFGFQRTKTPVTRGSLIGAWSNEYGGSMDLWFGFPLTKFWLSPERR